MNILRISIVTIAGFIALTAMGGGIAILVGADEFPLEWLSGVPFKDYTLPALILIFVVGGSSLIAAIAAMTQNPIGSLAAAIAGIIMAGHCRRSVHPQASPARSHRDRRRVFHARMLAVSSWPLAVETRTTKAVSSKMTGTVAGFLAAHS